MLIKSGNGFERIIIKKRVQSLIYNANEKDEKGN